VPAPDFIGVGQTGEAFSIKKSIRAKPD